MKKLDIFNLVSGGILQITNYDLEPAHAYKVTKFRTAVNKALDDIKNAEKDILNGLGIADPVEVDKKIYDLKSKNPLTEEEQQELEHLQSLVKKFNETRRQMLEEEVTLENVKTLPFEQWHALRKENRPKDANSYDPLNNYAEELLEGVLWKAPEDK